MRSTTRQRPPVAGWTSQVMDLYTLSALFLSFSGLRKINATLFSIVLVCIFGLACQRDDGIRTLDRNSPNEEGARPDVRETRAILKVGTSGDYPPFSAWPVGQAEPDGFSIDVARAWAKSEGRPIEWVRFSWGELAADLSAGRFDAAFSGVTVRPDRWQQGRFSLPLTTSGAIALVDPRSGLRSRSDLDRPEVAIAVNAGGHLERVARVLFPSARLQAIPRNQDVLGQLARDDIDAVLTDSLEAPIWQALQPGLRSIGPLTSDRKAAWFSKLRAADLQGFDRWLLDAERDGTLARIRAQHSIPMEPTALPGSALLASLDERLSLMTDVATAKRTLRAPVEDMLRETRVLAAALRSVRDEATRMGVAAPDADAVLRLYRAQIEAAKQLQRSWLADHPGPSSPASVAEQAIAHDRLETEIRPALLFLGDRIATLLVLSTTGSSRPVGEASADSSPVTYEQTVRALRRHDLAESQLRELHTALVEVGVR